MAHPPEPTDHPVIARWSVAVAPTVRRVVGRVVWTIGVVWAVMTLCFVLVELTPGDGVRAGATEEAHVRGAAAEPPKAPIHTRYVTMMSSVARLDFGRSTRLARPCVDLIAERLPNTLLLSGTTLLVLFPTGILLGVTQAFARGRAADALLSAGSVFMMGLPTFWLAVMLQLVVAPAFGLPISGRESPMYDVLPWTGQIADVGAHLLLPGVAMGFFHAAGLARYVRASMVETLALEHVRTARAKGVSGARVLFVHALRVALIPVLTWLGLSIPMLFSGSVLVEYTFGWPGMGLLLLQSALSDDLPMLVACFFFFSLLVVIGNAVADALVALADPRIRAAT
jgi:peptide/nickel transport system permease protein